MRMTEVINLINVNGELVIYNKNKKKQFYKLGKNTVKAAKACKSRRNNNKK